MMLKVVTLLEQDPEGHRILHGKLKAEFLDGRCYDLAIALHEGLDWPIVGLMEDEIIRHAVVQISNEGFYDARGLVTLEELGQPFGHIPPYNLVDIPPDKLRTIGTHPHTIMRARNLAETLWPELPWKDSLISRLSSFAKGLEELSREHGVWIAAQYPMARPLLALGGEDKEGYTMRGTITNWTIDREFNN